MSLPITGVGGVSAAAPAPSGDKKTDKAGEGFERVLLGQLTTQLVENAFPAGEEASAATNSYRDLLPDALTEALMSAGGIGLATTLKELDK